MGLLWIGFPFYSPIIQSAGKPNKSVIFEWTVQKHEWRQTFEWTSGQSISRFEIKLFHYFSTKQWVKYMPFYRWGPTERSPISIGQERSTRKNTSRQRTSIYWRTKRLYVWLMSGSPGPNIFGTSLTNRSHLGVLDQSWRYTRYGDHVFEPNLWLLQWKRQTWEL